MADIKTFPIVKLKVNSLLSNDYNPKKSYAEDKANYESYVEVKDSIEKNWYMGWIIVREEDWKYIIVDGFHRTSAMKELGRWEKEIDVTNLWKISKQEAIAKTIVIEETSIPIDKVLEANLRKDMRDSNELTQAVIDSSPYEMEQIEAVIQIVEYDFDSLVTPKIEEDWEKLKEIVAKEWFFVTEIISKK